MSCVIGVDFDGTVVEHMYPEIGLEAPGALRVLTRLQDAGHRLVLWTMRSGEELQAATDYLQGNGINLFGVNRNPEQDTWTQSPKAYCQLYIDDAALGCPTRAAIRSRRPVVCWESVEADLVKRGLLPASDPRELNNLEFEL